MFARIFGELGKDDSALAGGKGASLGDLVEVDADRGVVRVIERAKEQTMHVSGKEPIFTQTGKVLRGSRQAKTLGFPTANIPYEREEIAGTYAGQVTVHGAVYKAAVYADPKRGLLEAHLFGFSGDLYGEEIRITLLAKVAEAAEFTLETDAREFITQVVQKVKDYFQI